MNIFMSLGGGWRWSHVPFLLALLVTACGPAERPEAAYVPIAELEKSYGPIVTAGNHPTGDQNGTGDRLGLFRDASGTIWGLPLRIEGDGRVLACAPSWLREAKVTDTYPAGLTIVGTSNAPTGHRGGTGTVELVLRDARGNLRWQAVNGAHSTAGPICRAQVPPGPEQDLGYYRLVPAADRG